MTTISADERLQRRIGLLGEEAGRFTINLENDLFALRILWQNYIAFFGSSEERVSLLNSISGPTALQIQRAFLNSAILGVCRLTDPTSSMGKKNLNLTVHNLPRFLTAECDNKLSELLKLASEKSEFARVLRNKRIAHTDIAVRLGKEIVHSATNEKVRSAIDSIASCIRRFAYIELETELVTHPVGGYENDEVKFLEVLYLGHVAYEKRKISIKELVSQRRYAEIEAIEKLPEWVTFRPADEIDLD